MPVLQVVKKPMGKVKRHERAGVKVLIQLFQKLVVSKGNAFGRAPQSTKSNPFAPRARTIRKIGAPQSARG